jgi:hypothetical protein
MLIGTFSTFSARRLAVTITSCNSFDPEESAVAAESAVPLAGLAAAVELLRADSSSAIANEIELQAANDSAKQ